MMQLDRITLGAVFIIFWGGYTLSAYAAPVGKVIFASGKCFAENNKKERRKIRRASKLSEGDTIYTQSSSKAQIRFVDGAVISLSENTTFKVSEYEYSEVEAKSNLELIKGGLRAITGKITSKDGYEYTVKTPLASFSAEDAYWSATLVPVSGSPRADLMEPLQLQQELPTLFAEAELPPLVPTHSSTALYGAPGQDNLKTELYTAVWRGEVSGTTNTGQAFNMGPSQDTNFGKIGQDSTFVALLEQPETVAVKTDRKSSEQLAVRQERSRQESTTSTGTSKPQQTTRQARQQRALALPPIATIASIAPIPEPLIDSLTDVVSTDLSQQLLADADAFGVVMNRINQADSYGGGIAKIIDRGTGDAIIGDDLSVGNVIESISKGASGTFTPINPGASTGGSFNWDTDTDINLLYGSWANPIITTTSAVANLSEVYFAIATPMANGQPDGFSGIFDTVDFFTKSDNVISVSNLSLDVTYNNSAHTVAINDFDFDLTINKTGGGTINYMNLITLTKAASPGARFDMRHNNLTCAGCGTFDADLQGTLSGRVKPSLDFSEVGVVGVLNIHSHNNNQDNAQIIFGLSD